MAHQVLNELARERAFDVLGHFSAERHVERSPERQRQTKIVPDDSRRWHAALECLSHTNVRALDRDDVDTPADEFLGKPSGGASRLEHRLHRTSYQLLSRSEHGVDIIHDDLWRHMIDL